MSPEAPLEPAPMEGSCVARGIQPAQYRRIRRIGGESIRLGKNIYLSPSQRQFIDFVSQGYKREEVLSEMEWTEGDYGYQRLLLLEELHAIDLNHAVYRSMMLGAIPFEQQEITPHLERSIVPGRRKHQVLKHHAMGYKKAEIGNLLGVSKGTIQSHDKNLMAILGARNIRHAIRRGFEVGIFFAVPPQIPIGQYDYDPDWGITTKGGRDE